MKLFAIIFLVLLGIASIVVDYHKETGLLIGALSFVFALISIVKVKIKDIYKY